MKNTTIENYYVVKSECGNGKWFEHSDHYAFIEDVEAIWNTQSKYVKVFKRKVTTEEEEVQ